MGGYIYDAKQNQGEPKKIYIHGKRNHVDIKIFELYRCFGADQSVLFSGQAIRFGKPISNFERDGNHSVGEIRNRKGYLVNGRTDIHDLDNQSLLGSYTMLSRVYNGSDQKIGRWRDAQSWSDAFKINLVDAIANTLLGSGDVPGVAIPSDTHLLTDGKEILATLQREKLPFFPDSPKRTSPGKLATFASKIIPGERGKSLGEITPPRGWTLILQPVYKTAQNRKLICYSAVYRIAYMRWSRSA